MYFAQMCEYIDITRDDLYEELKKLESEKKILSSIITQSKALKFVFKYSIYFYNY